MRVVIFILFLALLATTSKAQDCDISTNGVAIVNAANTAPVSSICVGEHAKFKFSITNAGTSSSCTIPANSVRAVFSLPNTGLPYSFVSVTTPASPYFSWTYNGTLKTLVGTNTIPIPNGLGDDDILVDVIGNTAGAASSVLNLTQLLGISDNTGNNTSAAQLTIKALPVISVSAAPANDLCPNTNVNVTFNVTETASVGGTFNWVAKDQLNNTLAFANGVAYGAGAVNQNFNQPCNTTITFTFTPVGPSPTNCSGVPVTRVVNIRDLVAPVITTSAVSGSLGCNPTVVAPTFTGTDNCEGTITPVVTTTGPSNTGCAWTQTWNANYTDACGNVATQVSITYTWTVDITPPVITTSAVSGSLGCNPTVVAPAFTGTDNCEGTITPVVTTTGPSNTGCAWTQTWNANYTDACGNVATQVSITYTWTVDITPPVITTSAVSGSLGCNPTVVAPAFTGTDNCEGTITPVVTTTGPSNTGCAWTQTWNANYTDACGNVATQVSITYTWTVDITPPVITTSAVSGSLGCNPTVVAPAFTGTDNCEGTITPVVTTTGPSNTGCAWTQTWNANYTDACGNVATQVSITYTWTVDITPPVITTSAVSGSLGCNPTVVAPAFTGTDNCEGTITPVVTTAGPSNTGCAWTQTWNANYTDACGNVATQVSITYTWTVDITPPVITTSAVSGSLGCNPTVVAPAFTGTDNCEGTITPVVTTTGPSNTGCAWTQTWNANYTDACGNVATQVSITYTWTVDITPPVITTSAVSGSLGCNPTVVAPAFTGTDNCEGTITPVVTTTGPSNTGCAWTQTWNANYTDACGNVATQVSITYTWTVDITPPVITTSAVSGSLGCNPTVVAPAFTGTDNCEGTITPVVTTTGPSNTGCAWTQTWNANYTDACGNVATQVSITYTWTVDITPPVITTSAVSGSLGCNPTVVAPAFTGTDNCEGTITPVVTTTGPSNTGCAWTQTWNANYTDACGNVATQVSITYTWTVDITPPVITTSAVSGSLGCNPTVVAPAFTGTDNCEGTITPVVTTAGPSNTGCAWTQTWNANYTDACGNVATQVSITYTWTVDITPPVITTSAVSGSLGCNPTVVAPAFTGTDNCEGTITPVVTTTGPSNTGCAWTQTWNANYTDACGNVATQVSITYTWTVDITPPVITTSAVSGSLGCNPTVVAPAFTGTDNCEGTITPVVTTTGPSNTGCAWTQTWNANYTDACGNVATQVSITYTWTVDITPPVITTSAVSGSLGCNPTVVAPAFTGTDNCEGTITPVVTTTGPSNTGCAWTQTWNANYTDACGNVATQVSITYTWTVDITPPVITTSAVSGSLGCNPTVVAPAFTGTDNCEGTITPVVTTTGPSNTGCAWTQTWNANYTDACGNVATQVSITYTWTVDITPPVITTSAVSGSLGCNPTVVAPAFTGTDNCEGTITPVVTTTGPSNTGCAWTQTWNANYTDACGNVATQVSITYTWTVDITPPVITTSAVSGSLGCNPTVVAPAFTGTDNCEGTITPVVTTTGPSNTGCAWTQTWNANYTDACGNVATQVSITYTWTVDITPPVITTSAVSGSLGCNPTVVAPAFTGTDNCEGTITPVVTTAGPSNTGCAWTQTWNANYTDACGNVATQVSITYTWTVDITPPVITTSAVSGSLGCNPTVVAPAFTGTDNCEGTITPVVTTTGPSNTGCAWTQTWNANYTDACGNVATQVSITYTWTVDITPPVITTSAVSGSLGCNPTVVAPAFTGTDNCEGTITPVVTTTGPSNTGCAWTQTWNANYTDACGNVATQVSITYTWTVDITPPVITTSAVSGSLGCNPTVVAPAFTGTDNCEGTITPVVTTTGPSNTGCAWTQTWNANYTDACGNVATQVSITYTWTVDITPPVITTSAVSGSLGCNPTVVAPAFTGTDNCEGTITPVVTTTGPSNTGCAWTQTWNANYTDACGNVATQVSITYTWTVDITPPVITTSAVSGSLGCNPTVVAPAFTGTDNCEGTITPVVTTTGPSNTGCAWTQTWNANYTDACGNVATQVSITYTWTVDITPPVITTSAVSGSLGCNPTVVAPAFTGTDNCEGTITPVVTTTGPSNTGCAWTQTWNANYTDACGNVATQVSITYTWTVDITPPVITTSAVSGSLGCNPTVVAPAFTGTDNCEGTITPVVTTAGPSNTGCAWTQTWNANYTDACGNVATQVSITYTWTVDITPPALVSCSPQIINASPNSANCQYITTITDPVFTDNCGVATVSWSMTGSGAVIPTSGSGAVGSHAYGVGTTTITFIATDGCGNTTQCVTMISVANNLAATISGTTTVVQGPGSTPVTFSGSGGTTPYTFTYKINGGSNQTVTTTGSNTSVAVQQSTVVAGTYVYTLVSIADAFGCSYTLPANTTATVTVVVGRPDLFSAVSAPLNTQFINLQEKEGYVTISNAAAVTNPTTGTISFTISYVFNFDLEILGTTTSISSGSITVNNTDWIITAGAFGYTLTSKPGVVINGGFASSKIGFKLKATGFAASNGIMTVSIFNDTGGASPGTGDSNNTNNQSVKLFTIN